MASKNSRAEYKKSAWLAIGGLVMTVVGLLLFLVYINSDSIFTTEQSVHKGIVVIIAVSLGSLLTSLGGCVLCYGGCTMVELKLTNAQIRTQNNQSLQENRISWNAGERASEPRASVWSLSATR